MSHTNSTIERKIMFSISQVKKKLFADHITTRHGPFQFFVAVKTKRLLPHPVHDDDYDNAHNMYKQRVESEHCEE